MYLTLINLKKRYQEHFVLVANYLLIAYAFFLPISNSGTRTLFIFILLLTLLSGNLKEKFKFVLKDKVVQAFVLFYMMHLFWGFSAADLDILKYKLGHSRYILYIIIYMMVLRHDFIYKILTGFLLGVFFSEIVSYLMLYDIYIPYLVYSGGGVNVPFMSSYTQYSTLLSISLGVLLYGIITIKQNIFLKLIYVLFFISASSNIFIIQSKLGYGLYSISIIIVAVLIILKHKKYWMVPLAFLLIIGGYSIAYNVSQIFHDRVNGFIYETKNAVDKQNYHTATGTRIGFNNYGFELIKNNFLFGVGTGDHVEEFLNYIKENESNKANYNSMKKNLDSGELGSLHSEFLDNSIQFGVVGLLIFINIFYQLLRYPYKDYYMKVIQVIFVMILLSVSTVSLIFLYAKIGKIFTLLSALTLNVYYNKEKIE